MLCGDGWCRHQRGESSKMLACHDSERIRHVQETRDTVWPLGDMVAFAHQGPIQFPNTSCVKRRLIYRDVRVVKEQGEGLQGARYERRARLIVGKVEEFF